MKCRILQILAVRKLSCKETQPDDRSPRFPSASLREEVSTPAEPSGTEKLRETDRWLFTCPEKL